MKPVVSAAQMTEMDKYTIHELGIQGIILMENAGRGIVKSALSLLHDAHNKIVHIYCGSGNNGGDGYVVARHLLNMGARVQIYILAPREKIKGDADLNLRVLEKICNKIYYIEDLPGTDVESPDLIIDAMLGTGVERPLHGLYSKVVDYINSLQKPVLSVDIPTGVNADSGDVQGPAIKAVRTATMALLKRGLLFSPGREYAGHIDIVAISMPPQVIALKNPQTYLVEESDIKKMLPLRSPDVHKNSCGTVAVVGGSRGFTGAPSLTAEATLRTGAGLSYLCIPKSLNLIFETKITEVISYPFDDADSGYLHFGCLDELLAQIEKLDVIALGPGMGQHEETQKLIYALLENLKKPMVLDADGLNAAAKKPELLSSYKGEMVLTPHPGELSRLTGLSTKEIAANRFDIARKFASEWGKVLVVKGGPTLIALPDGNLYINSTGNGGMATGGTGDVLTGIVAGLLAQGLSADLAAIAGVYIHGYAGDLARDELGERGMIAGDLLKKLPLALVNIEGR
jgi:ADP-dependent NAD(P)H-hydrate dehydratase / NAD(P)H-hydrate epimerase